MKTFRNVCRLLSLSLMIAGLYFLHYCWMNHWCMGGHMEHPPYPQSEYINDYIWKGLFIGSVVCCLFSDSVLRLSVVLFCVLAFLGLPVMNIMVFALFACVFSGFEKRLMFTSVRHPLRDVKATVLSLCSFLLASVGVYFFYGEFIGFILSVVTIALLVFIFKARKQNEISYAAACLAVLLMGESLQYCSIWF